MKKVIELNEKCGACSGTGLYVGMGELDGAAIVCMKCNGTGCHKYRHEYEDFESRTIRPSVKHVYETNPGICIETGNTHQLEDFGGMPYSDWLDGKPFEPGMEMRNFVCPARWFQRADYRKNPEWSKCFEAGSFSTCKHYANKAKCWKQYDMENTKG